MFLFLLINCSIWILKVPLQFKDFFPSCRQWLKASIHAQTHAFVYWFDLGIWKKTKRYPASSSTAVWKVNLPKEEQESKAAFQTIQNVWYHYRRRLRWIWSWHSILRLFLASAPDGFATRQQTHATVAQEPRRPSDPVCPPPPQQRLPVWQIRKPVICEWTNSVHTAKKLH